MNIPINEKYRISSDSRQWMIQRYRPNKSKTTDWESQSYFPTLTMALNALRERLIRESDGETIEDALEATNRAKTTLSQALPGRFIVFLDGQEV